MSNKLLYIKKNWKLIIHLLFRTKRFGVNNEWRVNFDSFFGVPVYRMMLDIITIVPILRNYRMMRYRAQLGFISEETYKALFGT